MSNEEIAVPSNEISSSNNVLKYFGLWNAEYYFVLKISKRKPEYVLNL